MDHVQRYAISLFSLIGTHTPPRTVVVHRTADIMDGLPVYETGTVPPRPSSATTTKPGVLGADATPTGPTLPAHSLP
ncbi:DUF6296 family protein [Kitasatospora sp. NBC_01302]|uniref:DUF6296 family protein n=1 Tax=Kitasatospora sp. NBC_01302 TaxID=2903575 RepID=UPI003FA34D15